jgi:hypothetical protein
MGSEAVSPLGESAYASSNPFSVPNEGVEYLACGHDVTSLQESCLICQEFCDRKDEQAEAAETSFSSRPAEPVVTDLWAGYRLISIGPSACDSRIYASPLEEVARIEMQWQRAGKYRAIPWR